MPSKPLHISKFKLKLKLISFTYFQRIRIFQKQKKKLLKAQNCWLSRGYGGIVKLSSGKRAKNKLKKAFSSKTFLTNRLTFQHACLETFEMKAKTAIQVHIQSIIYMVGPHSRDQQRKVSCYDTQQFIKGQTLRHPKYYYSRPHFAPKLFYTLAIYMESVVFG